MANEIDFPGAPGDAGRAAALALCLALAPCVARADAGPPMLSDDPGTVPVGRWEINIATLSEHAADATTYELPLLDVNYGAGDRLQLKFEMPWIISDTAHGSTHAGVGNSLIGAKWRFYDGGEEGWRISTYPQIESTFPFARTSHGIAESGVRYLLPVEAQHDFGSFTLNLEAGRWLRPGKDADTWVSGIVIGHELRKGFVLMAELRDETDIHFSHDEMIVNFGAHIDLSERYSLLLSAGRDLHNGLGETNTLLTYAGIQLHL